MIVIMINGQGAIAPLSIGMLGGLQVAFNKIHLEITKTIMTTQKELCTILGKATIPH